MQGKRHHPDDNRNRAWIWRAAPNGTKKLHDPDYTERRHANRQGGIWLF